MGQVTGLYRATSKSDYHSSYSLSAQTHEAQSRAGLAIAGEVIRVLNIKEPRWRVTHND
jgi:hypothetical protein